MERSVFRYILRHSLRSQILLTLIALTSLPFLYAFYELPKRIINGAIQGRNIVFPVEHLGLEFDQIEYLFLLSFIFLFLVGMNQAFKYTNNLMRGRVGERLLRRLRYDLYSRVLRFPQPHFRGVSSGSVVQMITAEVEPLGGFFGAAVAVPVTQGGTLIVILTFLFLQNPYMAAAAVALYPVQFYLIPKLQRKVNNFGKERVRRVRRLSDHISESIAGSQEIHAHGTAAYELAGFSRGLGGIYEIRLQIYIWKFIIKFANNTINQLGPFAFYTIGGYLVIQGELQIGTLVAAIAAHKDIAAPWKELLAYYQQQADARIKFEQVAEQFEPAGMIPTERQLDGPEAAPRLEGEVLASNLSFVDETGVALADSVSFVLPANAHVAIVGDGASGKGEVAQLLAGLLEPSAGAISIGGNRVSDLHEVVLGMRMGYVGPSVALSSATVADNLVYGLQHRPISPPDYSEAERRHWREWFEEAALAGNSTDDRNADWVNLAAAGVVDRDGLRARMFEILSVVGMERDIYEMGLRGTIDPAREPALAQRVLDARAALRARLAEPDIAALVEIFDAGTYNDNLTLGENLLFGTPVDNAFDMNRLAENPYVLRVLDAEGLSEDLLGVGLEVAATMVELFADLAPGHEFFEQYSFIGSDDLPDYQALLARINRDGMSWLGEADRTRLLSLPFMVSPARHRLGLIDDTMKRRILAARGRFARELPPELSGAVEFFDSDRFNAATTLQDNILFGRVAYGQAHGTERVGRLIREVVEAEDLRHGIMEVGIAYHVGVGGSRLSQSRRQRLGLARAVLKRPDLLVLNEALAGVEGEAQARILDALHTEFAGRGMVCALSRAGLARDFDRIIVMRAGRVVEQGSFAELDHEGTAFKALLGAQGAG